MNQYLLASHILYPPMVSAELFLVESVKWTISNSWRNNFPPIWWKLEYFPHKSTKYLREKSPQRKEFQKYIWHTAYPEVGRFRLGPFYSDFWGTQTSHGFKRILQYFYAGYTNKIQLFSATKNHVNIAVGCMFLNSPYLNCQGTKNELTSWIFMNKIQISYP